MPFIYVDVHLKSILAVTLFSTLPEVRVSEDGVLQDYLPVKFKDPKFMQFHENRYEAFIFLKLFHNLFAINFFCC